jgi:MFS family permease
MYSDADLTEAVAAGAISRQAADALRAFVAQRQAAPTVDEEQFRLLTGFNDIFVSIATTLLLTSAWWLAAEAAPALGTATLAVLSWALAEYFTRQRRMALPSILLLGTFTGGVFSTAMILSAVFLPATPTNTDAWPIAAGALIAVGATVLHWRRFHVPITVAAGALALVGTVIAVITAIRPDWERAMMAVILVCGLGVFALAMWWDMSDRTRITRRADVAFWLHLLASPLIVHPAFKLLGLLDSDDTNLGRAAAAVAVYAVLAIVALVVDRRALLVSALFYVLYAISALLKAAGALSFSLALTALVAGSALLVLSAFWHATRRGVLGAMPSAVRAHVPAA